MSIELHHPPVVTSWTIRKRRQTFYSILSHFLPQPTGSAATSTQVSSGSGTSEVAIKLVQSGYTRNMTQNRPNSQFFAYWVGPWKWYSPLFNTPYNGPGWWKGECSESEYTQKCPNFKSQINLWQQQKEALESKYTCKSKYGIWKVK